MQHGWEWEKGADRGVQWLYTQRAKCEMTDTLLHQLSSHAKASDGTDVMKADVTSS